MIEQNTQAPDFTLLDEQGHERTLSEFFSKGYTLLYFYPKDDTPGCTQEACMIRDVYHEFEKMNISVIGISADYPGSHKKFKEKYELPFTLLSDPEKKVIAQYGAKGAIFTRRISYLLDTKGIVIRSYVNVDPATHAVQILNDVKDIIT